MRHAKCTHSALLLLHTSWPGGPVAPGCCLGSLPLNHGRHQGMQPANDHMKPWQSRPSRTWDMRVNRKDQCHPNIDNLTLSFILTWRPWLWNGQRSELLLGSWADGRLGSRGRQGEHAQRAPGISVLQPGWAPRNCQYPLVTRTLSLAPACAACNNDTLTMDIRQSLVCINRCIMWAFETL